MLRAKCCQHRLERSLRAQTLEQLERVLSGVGNLRVERACDAWFRALPTCKELVQGSPRDVRRIARKRKAERRFGIALVHLLQRTKGLLSNEMVRIIERACQRGRRSTHRDVF